MTNHGIEQVQYDVEDFMRSGNQHCPDSPCLPDPAVRELRVRLIAEELMELAAAYGVSLKVELGGTYPCDEDEYDRIVAAYDAVLDLMYVVAGTAVAQGTQMAPGWVEVQRSNMAKFGPGGSIREDGKILKPPGWTPPDLRPIVMAQCRPPKPAN